MSIFIADTSSLKSRGFAYAFASSPYIATVWIGGPIAQSFLNGAGFRWGFGTFAIVTPIVTMPLFALFMFNYNKAKKMGLIKSEPSGRSIPQSIAYYIIQFDLFGLLLICGGLSLFLLPFNLYSFQTDGWKSPLIICMIVFGVVLLIAFGVYEKFFAPVTFIPFGLLTDRTVLGAYILAAVLFVEFYVWDSYFFSFLQVVNNLNVTQSSYIANIYSIGSCFFSLIVGIAIRWTGKFKWIALYFGVPLTILGVGLMIRFRAPNENIGYIIMCQIFIAFSGGALVICEQIAAMAAATHQQVAVVLAVEGMFSSIGGAIGSTIAAAIWTGVFPKQLAKHLPEDALANLTDIYGSLTVQLSYEVGTPTRDAIIISYGEAQKLMLITATVVLVLAIGSVAVWRDIDVKKFKQVKGMVF
jgi:MFS family permease